MQWFKHDTDATLDGKLRKVILRYGTDGYAIYFHCLELIAGNISDQNITFELEHDSEVIADTLKVKSYKSDQTALERVEEIMRFMVDEKLFEYSNGHITCFKMLKRLDSSMTSNAKMRALITNAKENHDTVMINHDTIMQEEIRIDKNRQEENKEDTPDKPAKKTVDKPYSQEFENFWDIYPKREGKKQSYKVFNALLKNGITQAVIHERLKTYKARIQSLNTGYEYIRNPSTFLNNLEDYASGYVPTRSAPFQKPVKDLSNGYVLPDSVYGGDLP